MDSKRVLRAGCMMRYDLRRGLLYHDFLYGTGESWNTSCLFHSVSFVFLRVLEHIGRLPIGMSERS